MPQRHKYFSRANRTIVAVRIDLDTTGLVYRKWGGRQRARRGDWLVDNEGEIYTVASRVFARTYREVRRGAYRKITPVWARRATEPGWITTKEGRSKYRTGDYLVYNQRNGRDGYCMTPAKFRAAYRRAE